MKKFWVSLFLVVILSMWYSDTKLNFWADTKGCWKSWLKESNRNGVCIQRCLHAHFLSTCGAGENRVDDHVSTLDTQLTRFTEAFLFSNFTTHILLFPSRIFGVKLNPLLGSFSNKGRKTNTKVITSTNRKRDKQLNESEFRNHLLLPLRARENSGTQGAC